jgi:hypothetical protein
MVALSPGGNSDTVMALTPLPSLKHDTSSAPRMLTSSEIDWLRRHKQGALDVLLVMAKEQLTSTPRAA